MGNVKLLNELSGQVIDSAVAVHREVGPGLLESVYEVLLAHELRERGLVVERQKVVPIEYRGIRFDEGYRLDLMIESMVIVEIKSIESLQPVHSKQLLTYLRLTECPLGLLLNFNTNLTKEGIVRLANNAPE
ncbi:hypothetical protein MalM25_02420 [Planctomycetes bacterium MalM25]|nr:hypothetical protein MalM25_02420 [Planctomycetes bacterium MalM25]